MSWQEQPRREEQIEVKERFSKRYKQLLGEHYDEFMECNMHYLRRAIRVNTLKAGVKGVKDRLSSWKLTKVPWCKEAFWIKGERRDIGNLLEHQLGYVYVQDPASMLPPVVLSPSPSEKVLDMCASPGSKTSQAAAMMKNSGIIVANDSQGSRLAPLGVNLQKLGVMNTILTKRDGRSFKRFEFDRVMVDAPCSGTGTIRRSLKGIYMYNPRQVEHLARTQLGLAKAAFEALRPGGVMTYSTCTLEPLENEAVISQLLDGYEDAKIEPIRLDIKREKPFTEQPDTAEKLREEVSRCLRIHPYTNDTEGFFVAKIRKNA